MKRILPVLAGAIALSGCGSVSSPIDPAYTGPYFKPTNVAASPRLPADIQRVVLLPAWSPDGLNEPLAVELDAVLRTELSRMARFEVTAIDRDSLQRMAPPHRALDSTARLPHGFLTVLMQKTGAQAVMFVDLPRVVAYPPLEVSIRAKLVRLDTQETLWAADNLFSGGAPEVRNAARKHFLQGASRPFPADLSSTALQSPSRFAEYAAAATFATLPVR